MKLDFIDLDHLSIAATNMRKKGKDPDVSGLLPSVRARGVLVPLLVRPNCSHRHYESSPDVGALPPSMPWRARAELGGLPCAILDDADGLEALMLEILRGSGLTTSASRKLLVTTVKSGVEWTKLPRHS
ncbi:hypothetical protein [Sphingopyxis kveilinensis]|uniref:hypothetical protein n=1 Tax=Sphingopyxis kveilinensis TaxID=3114367 RepID=UPI0030D48C29